MWKRRLSGTFAEIAASEQGLVLPAVLGVVVVLMVIVAGMTAIARSELRAARLESEVAQRHLLVYAGMQRAARMALNNQLTRWDPTLAKAAQPQPYVNCTWTPAAAPHYCIDAFKETTRSMTIGGIPYNNGQLIPVRVQWRLSAAETPRLAYGWVFKAQTGQTFVYYDHLWCPVKKPWAIGDPEACEQGG